MTILSDLRADTARYTNPWYFEPGFWATVTYRWGRWGRTLKGPGRLLVLAPQKLFNQYFHIVYQLDISPHAEIGPGLTLIHPRNVLIGGCKIGKNCLIFQEVTLGMDANSLVFPELGDDVDIYAGARVIGEIRLGNGVKVGANCVVSQSVPDGCTVVVAKNRVIPRSLVEAFGPRRKPSSPPAKATEPTKVDAPPPVSEPAPPAEVRPKERSLEKREETPEPLEVS
ncbi:MAG: serine acetyltransferase [Myxococcales bacterium]